MKKLLLVDAEPFSRCVLDISLRKSGYQVATAVDGIEALSKAAAFAPDVVIADTQLPRLDGFGFVRRLREHPEYANTPVIFVVTQPSVDDQRLALALGIEDYLAKPVFTGELVARIQLLLALRAQRLLAGPSSAMTHGHFSGSTDEVSLIDLLQSFDFSASSGILHLRSGAREAHVYFRDGRVIDAELGLLRGEEAVYRALTWGRAAFEFQPRVLVQEDVVGCSTHALLIEGMHRVDDWVRLCEQLSPLAALFDVQPPALLERIDRLNELPEGLSGVLRRLPQEGGGARTAAARSPDFAADDAVALERRVAAPAPKATEALHATLPFPPVKPAISQRPSAAPWTTEVAPHAAHDHEDVAAGVPRAMNRTTQRVVMGTMAVAAVLLIAGGLRSVRIRQFQEAEAARAPGFVAATAAGYRPAPDAVAYNGRAASAVQGIAEEVPPPASEAIGSAEAAVVPAVEGAGPPAGGGGAAAADGVVMTAPAGDIRASANVLPSAGKAADSVHEVALDSKLQPSAQSPEVREVERALLRGDIKQALVLANDAVRSNPADADAWLTLAAAQKASGDVAGAREAYRGCISKARTVGVTDCRAFTYRAEK